MTIDLDKVFNPLAELLAPEVAETVWRLEKICESPIEVILGASMLWYDRIFPERLLMPQYQWEGRRIDWVFRDQHLIVFIECDGHDFHERTKQQAANDRQKDREIQRNGYPILRFTGSEIYANATGCAAEIFEFMGDLFVEDHFRRRSA
jgi:very-short-patch-repair endonuclease